MQLSYQQPILFQGGEDQNIMSQNMIPNNHIFASQNFIPNQNAISNFPSTNLQPIFVPANQQGIHHHNHIQTSHGAHHHKNHYAQHQNIQKNVIQSSGCKCSNNHGTKKKCSCSGTSKKKLISKKDCQVYVTPIETKKQNCEIYVTPIEPDVKPLIIKEVIRQETEIQKNYQQQEEIEIQRQENDILYQELTEKIENLTMNNQSIPIFVQKEDSNSQALLLELSFLRKEVEKLENQLNLIVNDNASQLNLQKIKFEQTINRLNDEISKRDSIIKQLIKKIKSRDLENLEKIQTLESELVRSKKTTKVVNQDQQLLNKISQLEDLLDDRELQIKTLESKVSTMVLRKDFNELQDKFMKKKTKNSQLKDQIDNSKIEHDQLKNTIQEWKNSFNQLNAKYAALQSQNTFYRQQLGLQGQADKNLNFNDPFNANNPDYPQNNYKNPNLQHPISVPQYGGQYYPQNGGHVHHQPQNYPYQQQNHEDPRYAQQSERTRQYDPQQNHLSKSSSKNQMKDQF